ncbi:MAG: hypothetical protein IPL50_06005 [Chitinophagaceae bacterium]|nr:hypothetical protein [Chitinophagaceae bacterium]
MECPLNFYCSVSYQWFIVFTVNFINPAIDPPAIIVNKQADYINLPVASTQIPLTPLQPNLWSFVTNAPQALQHIFKAIPFRTTPAVPFTFQY